MIVFFVDSAAQPEDGSPDPARVTAGDPRATAAVHATHADGRVLAGTWTCTPGRWRVQYDEWEYCHITAGRGALHPDDATPRPIGPGDAFVVPPGFTGEWEVSETMTKQFVVVLPA